MFGTGEGEGRADFIEGEKRVAFPLLSALYFDEELAQVYGVFIIESFSFGGRPASSLFCPWGSLFFGQEVINPLTYLDFF